MRTAIGSLRRQTACRSIDKRISKSDLWWIFRYVNKELNVARIKVYFNSQSEMLVPTSLWEQTLDHQLGILSALGPEEILDMMKS